LFDTYNALLEPTMAWVRTRTRAMPRLVNAPDNSATRAKAFDILRGLLPMATRTNVGLFGNGGALNT
jgi:thymidylate synthase ThyX